VAGRLQIVDFPDYAQLTREGSARFRAADPSTAIPAVNGTLRAGALEKSNVSMVERIAEMTEVSRIFEALQKGVSVLMNDIDGKAITELGRR
jgi:flagellar basal body rod protein FlgG